MTSRDYFKNKRIAVIGLGSNGEMVEDVKFLIKAGALVSVYDLKSEARLKNHLVFLRSIGLANYVCGSIPADDLLDMDIIILSHEYNREASFLKPLVNSSKQILIEYPETLFFRQAPAVTFVGIIGECGKSTLLSMLKPLLNIACDSIDGQNFFVIDSESNDGILTHLKKIRSGDIILVRMSSSIMKELYDMRISPHVAVFVSLPSDYSYNKTPFEILSMHAKPNGFVLNFTQKVDPATASDIASYKMNTFTYIYQAAYGSPEVDPTTPTISKAEVAADGLSVRLTIDGLQEGHVHELHADGVRSAEQKPLLHAAAYYTLNYIPAE